MIRVELSMGILTSLEAAYTVLSTSPGLFALDCLSLVNTFSTSTIESSTREPMAMAIPPRLIVFTVRPSRRIASRVTTIDRGMDTSEMSVVLQFIRNMKRTMTTNNPPSSSDLRTLPIDPSMKLDWRNISELTFTSEGSEALRSSKAESSLPVSSRVLVSGCFVTVSSTAGLPSLEATPRTGALAPVRTRAMSSRVTG